MNPKQNLEEIISKCKEGLKFVFLFSLFVNLLMLTIPLFMLLVFDYVLTSFSKETLIFLTMIAIFALIIMAFFDVIRGYIIRRVAFWFESQLDRQSLKQIPDQILDGSGYGTQGLVDLANIRSFLTSPGVFALFDAPWMPIYILVIFLLSPKLGWFALAGAIILLLIGIFNEFISRASFAKTHSEAMKNQQMISLVMRNVEAIQAMGMMENITKKWKNNNTSMIELLQNTHDKTGVISSFSKFIRLFLQLGILVIGAYLVINEQLTPGGMIAASILLSRALAPAEQSIGVWKQLLQAREALSNLKQHLGQDDARGTGIKLPEPKGLLTINDAIYKPENLDNPIIDKVSLSLNAGEVLAVVGPSGAGKTTLIRLCAGLQKPNSGSIRLDGADVFKWDRDDFGHYVGYLPQDIELLPGTIKENIARMSNNPDDEDIINASVMAGAHEFILKLPQAYDTEISMFHNILSGGQKQLIALARSFYKTPKLLLLDEPSSNLDAASEKKLFLAIKKLKLLGTTIIINTHHLLTLQVVDKIALISAGKIKSVRTREEVLRRVNAAYKKNQGNT